VASSAASYTTKVPKVSGNVTPSAASSFVIASEGTVSGVISGRVSGLPIS